MPPPCFITVPTPEFQAASATSMRPKRCISFDSRRAPVWMLCFGSSRRCASSARAAGVLPTGMICISPTAPRGETALGLKPDSTAMMAFSNSMSTPCVFDASRKRACSDFTSGAKSSQVSRPPAPSVLPGTRSPLAVLPSTRW